MTNGITIEVSTRLSNIEDKLTACRYMDVCYRVTYNDEVFVTNDESEAVNWVHNIIVKIAKKKYDEEQEEEALKVAYASLCKRLGVEEDGK